MRCVSSRARGRPDHLWAGTVSFNDLGDAVRALTQRVKLMACAQSALIGLSAGVSASAEDTTEQTVEVSDASAAELVFRRSVGFATDAATIREAHRRPPSSSDLHIGHPMTADEERQLLSRLRLQHSIQALVDAAADARSEVQGVWIEHVGGGGVVVSLAPGASEEKWRGLANQTIPDGSRVTIQHSAVSGPDLDRRRDEISSDRANFETEDATVSVVRVDVPRAKVIVGLTATLGWYGNGWRSATRMPSSRLRANLVPPTAAETAVGSGRPGYRSSAR